MNGALERLISAARRRVITNLAAERSIHALAVALAGAILLLLAGTQILSWYWPLLLFGVALAYGLWHIRRRIPTSYAVAQRVDRSLSLYDSLSTAWHYRNTNEDVLSDEVRAAQRNRAEEQAATIDPKAAIPLEIPRGLRWCALLGVVAGALFLTRYGVQKSLDLSHPLMTFNLDGLSSPGKVQEAANRQQAKSPVDQMMKEISIQPPDQQQNGLDPAPDSALGVVDTPDVNNDNAQPINGNTAEKGPGGEQGEKVEGTEASDNAAGGEKNADGNNPPGSNNDGKQSQQKDAKGQQADQPGENSSLMDKMRDAMANLMNKLNSQQQKESGQQQAQNSKGGQPSANARQQQAKQGPQGKGQPGAEQQSQNQQAGNENEDMDPSQSQQGKAGDKSSQQAASQENKSGMGKQDGDKDVKLAEQLAAMGKISEIIGKRNEKLQGEVMLEVSSSKQQLKTQYSQRSAQHGDSGGEIHRDEVPLIYQNYVQQYFEEVRKTPAAAKTK